MRVWFCLQWDFQQESGLSSTLNRLDDHGSAAVLPLGWAERPGFDALQVSDAGLEEQHVDLLGAPPRSHRVSGKDQDPKTHNFLQGLV